MFLGSSVFENFYLEGTGATVGFVVLLVVLVLAAVAVNVVPRVLHKWETEYKTRDITFGAVCLAMSFALSYAKMFQLPQGGSVTPAALAPLYIYCYYFGFRKGMVVSAAYMLLQFVQGAYVVSPWSAFFDYMLPCFSICIVGLFRYKPEKYSAFVKRHKDSSGVKGRLGYWAYTVGGHWGIFVGAAIHMIIRYLSSAVSGILFFGEWAGEGYGPVAWGFLYNTVLIVDSLIAIVAAFMLMSSRTFNVYMTAAFDNKSGVNAKNADDTDAQVDTDAQAVADAQADTDAQTEAAAAQDAKY